ncbi:MAG: cation diffusion facilitator family transporter [Anaerotruncus sp.]|nr:cation diffusion facilitator family transporter [Anaerotruncus sp.]
MDSRTTTIRKAGWIALFGNATLAIAKIIAGTVSNSLSVISDGIDSSTDVLIAAMTLVAASISAKPGDREHPYGHGRIETVASAVISFITVFFAGGQVFLTAMKDLIAGTSGSMPSVLALIITSLSVIGKLGLAWSQFHYGRFRGRRCLWPTARTCGEMS